MADSKSDPFRFEASPKLSMKRLAILIPQNIFKKGNDFPQFLLGEWAGFTPRESGSISSSAFFVWPTHTGGGVVEKIYSSSRGFRQAQFAGLF